MRAECRVTTRTHTHWWWWHNDDRSRANSGTNIDANKTKLKLCLRLSHNKHTAYAFICSGVRRMMCCSFVCILILFGSTRNEFKSITFLHHPIRRERKMYISEKWIDSLSHFDWITVNQRVFHWPSRDIYVEKNNILLTHRQTNHKSNTFIANNNTVKCFADYSWRRFAVKRCVCVCAIIVDFS